MRYREMRTYGTREGWYAAAYRRFLATVLSVAVGTYVVYQHLFYPALPLFPAGTLDVDPARWTSLLCSAGPPGTTCDAAGVPASLNPVTFLGGVLGSPPALSVLLGSALLTATVALARRRR